MSDNNKGNSDESLADRIKANKDIKLFSDFVTGNKDSDNIDYGDNKNKKDYINDRISTIFFWITFRFLFFSGIINILIGVVFIFVFSPGIKNAVDGKCITTSSTGVNIITNNDGVKEAVYSFDYDGKSYTCDNGIVIDSKSVVEENVKISFETDDLSHCVIEEDLCDTTDFSIDLLYIGFKFVLFGVFLIIVFILIHKKFDIVSCIEHVKKNNEK